MSSPYTPVSVSGYNSSPPSDDGSEVASNQLTWAKHKTKLGDPLKIAIEAIDTNTAAAFNSVYDQIQEEADALVTPSDYSFLPGDVRRYGAVFDDSSAPVQATNSIAIQAAIDVCKNNGITMVIEGGTALHYDTQLVIAASANVSCRMNVWQNPHALLYSHVTGSIDAATFETAGFGILFDAWRESKWYGFSLNYTNGTAGVAQRCRNQFTGLNDIYIGTIRGGTVIGDRTTRTKVSWRFIGNESVASSTGYACYWNNFFGGYMDIGAKLFECVIGDGHASTRQPNAQKVFGTQFERYLIAFDADDTDEHFISGAWPSNAQPISIGTASSVTQVAGTVTVTLAGHGLQTDDVVLIAGATPTDYVGTTRITRVDDDNFTYTKTNGVAVPSGTSSPATGTITVTHYSVFFQGNSTYSQIIANNESGGLGYFIEDGGSGGNIIQIIDNLASARSIVEDLTEPNVIIDRQYYSASGTWTARIGKTALMELTSSAAGFNVPVNGSGFRPDQVEVASATNITYTDSASVWRITGTTTINTITDPGDGSPIITLIFNTSLTFNDATTSSGNVKLEGGSDFSATADDVLTLIWDKTNSQWIQTGRSVN